jgi:hypothetical protein
MSTTAVAILFFAVSTVTVAILLLALKLVGVIIGAFGCGVCSFFKFTSCFLLWHLHHLSQHPTLQQKSMVKFPSTTNRTMRSWSSLFPVASSILSPHSEQMCDCTIFEEYTISNTSILLSFCIHDFISSRLHISYSSSIAFIGLLR